MEQAFINDLNMELLKEKDEENKKLIEIIIKNNLKKMYHDFESELCSPKTTLVSHLLLVGLKNMADNVIKGYYDF